MLPITAPSAVTSRTEVTHFITAVTRSRCAMASKIRLEDHECPLPILHDAFDGYRRFDESEQYLGIHPRPSGVSVRSSSHRRMLELAQWIDGWQSTSSSELGRRYLDQRWSPEQTVHQLRTEHGRSTGSRRSTRRRTARSGSSNAAPGPSCDKAIYPRHGLLTYAEAGPSATSAPSNNAVTALDTYLVASKPYPTTFFH